MEVIIEKLINLLPKYEDFKGILQNTPEANYIVQRALNALKSYSQNELKKTNDDEMEESAYLVQALVDKFWELIHTGLFSEVPLETRQIYAFGSFCKILFLLIENTDKQQVEHCSKVFDDAILLGCTKNLFTNSELFMEELTEMFDKYLQDDTKNLQLPVIETKARCEVKCDILQLTKPSLQDFEDKCFKTQNPALLIDTIEHWPAMQKWHNLNYLLKLAGNRIVPIEIGSNYATEEWSQQLFKIKDFLQRQFAQENEKRPNDIEYLAQHELFEQIPALKKDLSIPVYCSLGENKSPVDIKAWLGPMGTISPMHYDPKHNLLCQVFGSKHIILASPQHTKYLYPHEGEFLTNTSQINAANVDYEQFPETAKVQFYTLTLQRGDCLYIPPKWWHYVRSESPSFSVSFWWE